MTSIAGDVRSYSQYGGVATGPENFHRLSVPYRQFQVAARRVPDRLALVTDCNRALDMPDGDYMIGPLDGGEPLIKRDGVGLMPDGQALASSVEGMDHMVRTFAKLTSRPLWEVIRMASLTPARIAGRDRELGSLEKGKQADVVVFDRDWNVQRVFIDGVELSLK